MAVRCFTVEPTLTWRESLRRYRPGRGRHLHDASTVIGEVTRRSWKARQPVSSTDEHDPADPRWPTRCASPGCSHRFSGKAVRQLAYDRLWVDTRTGALLVLRDAEPGAMYDAWWLPDSYRGADGRALCVRLPNGVDWTIDGEATGGGGWQRSGEPPRITARPSIAAGTPGEPGYYHGWLTTGVLSDHLG